MKGLLFITLAMLIALTIPVAAQQAASGTISVVGEVKNPGQYTFKDGYTVQSAIADAGGFTEKADTTRAIVLHADKKSEQVTFSNPDAPTAILPGDTIVARKLSISVRVEGKVKKPGYYNFTPGMTLLQVYAAAGGADNGANLVDCCLDRKGKLMPVNLQALLDSNDMSENIELQSGDVLYVPESIVVVMGQVVAPGRYTLTDGNGMRILDVVKNAGGFSPTADQKKVVLSRLEGSGRKRFALDLVRADANNNLLLVKGDVIDVPIVGAITTNKSPFNLTNLQTIATILFYASTSKIIKF